MGASVGVLLLGGAAMVYHSWYKRHVLKKMEAAFDPGYDPSSPLQRAVTNSPTSESTHHDRKTR